MGFFDDIFDEITGKTQKNQQQAVLDQINASFSGQQDFLQQQFQTALGQNLGLQTSLGVAGSPSLLAKSQSGLQQQLTNASTQLGAAKSSQLAQTLQSPLFTNSSPLTQGFSGLLGSVLGSFGGPLGGLLGGGLSSLFGGLFGGGGGGNFNAPSGAGFGSFGGSGGSFFTPQGGQRQNINPF